jgi:hypothetical protein
LGFLQMQLVPLQRGRFQETLTLIQNAREHMRRLTVGRCALTPPDP